MNLKYLKRWQEPIYALGGFGPGFLYQVVISYSLYFYRPALSRIELGAIVLAPAGLYAILMLLARVLDGVVDIPIASWTDNMKIRKGKRKPLMIIGLVPAMISFILLWYPPITGSMLGPNGHWLNVVYLALLSSVFFFCYTLITVPYLATLSEIVPDEQSRVRVSSWKTFFATGGYVLNFVIAPILFDKFGIQATMWLLLPVFLSFLGPILVIKEGKCDDKEEVEDKPKEQETPLLESIKLTFKNKTFLVYMLSCATFFFGLQFFLGAIPFMAADMMGLSDSQLGLMNAAAFAPVPVMLIIFNFISKRRGSKLGYQIALLVFAAVMFLYPLAWKGFNFMPVSPIVWGIIMGVFASFSIAVFFTIPYAYPAEIAAVELKSTGRNRAGMYFAVQGLINQFMGSLAGSTLALLLTWKMGVLVAAPIAGVMCILACIFIRPYPLGGKMEKAS